MAPKQENVRTLSAAEEARRLRFEKTKEGLISEGFEAVDLTVGVGYANVMTLVLGMPPVLLLAVLFLIFHIDALPDMLLYLVETSPLRLLVLIVVFFVLIVLHELIHGITWSLFTKKHWRSISFGFIVKYLTPYCTCEDPLTKGQYLIGSLMPTLLLGVLPTIVSIVTGSITLFLIGVLMILSGGGDLTIAQKLISFKARGREVLYIDHPYEVGLAAFIKE